MIYKSPLLRKHIDLDKLLVVSDAYFLDRMGYGGWFVGFTLLFQLQDEPVQFTRGLHRDTEERFIEKHHELAYRDADGNLSWHRGELFDAAEKGLTIAGVFNLQRDIDELVKAWKACKGAEKKDMTDEVQKWD